MLASTSRDPDLAPFLRGGSLGDAFLILPSGGEPHLGYLTPMEREEAARTHLKLLHPEALGVAELRRQEGVESLLPAAAWRGMERLGVGPGRVGIAGSPRAGQLLELVSLLRNHGLKPESGDALSRLWRKPKSSWQLEEIRRASQGAVQGIRLTAEALAASESENGDLKLDGRELRIGQLHSQIAMALARLGLEQPEGWILAAGADAGVPHSRSAAKRVVCADETLVVDLFPRSRMFADCTRTFVMGTPSAEVAGAHAAICNVLHAAEEQAVPGSTAAEMQQAACEAFAEAGYPTLLADPGTERGYVHVLGHGVGFELHELPSFRASGDAGTLTVGDVFTLEPGLYDPEAGWGIRIENLYHLGPAGPENLTPLPLDLDPRDW